MTFFPLSQFLQVLEPFQVHVPQVELPRVVVGELWDLDFHRVPHSQLHRSHDLQVRPLCQTVSWLVHFFHPNRPHHTTTHHPTPNITITCRPSHLSNQHLDHLNSPPRTTTNLVLTCREFISKHVESVAAKIDPELDIVDEIERQVRIWQNWKTFQY